MNNQVDSTDNPDSPDSMNSQDNRDSMDSLDGRNHQDNQVSTDRQISMDRRDSQVSMDRRDNQVSMVRRDSQVSTDNLDSRNPQASQVSTDNRDGTIRPKEVSTDNQDSLANLANPKTTISMASLVRLTGQVHTEAADHIPAVTTFSTPREAPTARRTAAKDAFRNVSPKKEIEVSPVYQVYREKKGSAVSPERKA
jgi:hypothetical protein